MRRLWLALMCVGCVTHSQTRSSKQSSAVEQPPNQAAMARQTLERFVVAVENQDFEQAFELLDLTLRRRYSPARLQADFVLEPRGAMLVARAKAALHHTVSVRSERAFVQVADGAYAVLHWESGRWYVLSLDGDAEGH